MKEIYSNNYGKNKKEGLHKWLEKNINGYKRQTLTKYIEGFSLYLNKPNKIDTIDLASNNFKKWTKFVLQKINKLEMTKINENLEKENHEIELEVLGGSEEEKFINHLMHAADVFEKGKQFANYYTVMVTGNPNLTKLCENLANAYEKVGRYAVFIGIKSINGQKPENPHVWFMKDVQSISMITEDRGACWSLFKDILVTLGYNVLTDEHMRVIQVS